ncbi:MAG: polyprenyl synthetase family protein [Candidatus Pelagibacter sp.]|tara:strand:- start:13 stop:882 length:870 start_codon:yes stop_codon:yes gene_type:complete
MKKKLNKIAKDTNLFLKRYLKLQKRTDLLKSMKYGLLPGGKKIRSKILIDVGKIFNINYNILIQIGAAVECIHAYTLIHDDLPCMDNDDLRRGKLSTHKKYGESTAVLAGNSLLTLAFEILTNKNLKISDKKKILIIKYISNCSGHEGIAGGQYSDLNFENKKISLNKIKDMQIKKTGRLFSFCCVAPLIIVNRNNLINKFKKIGEDIGLLFQIADDLIDYSGSTKIAGKKTKKDAVKGKATLISLLGYKNTIKYSKKLKSNVYSELAKYQKRSNNLRETIEFILNRTN